MNCRHCSNNLKTTFLDLGYAPPSNNYLFENELTKSEIHFPLRVKVCNNCFLVQTEDYSNPEELFTDNYAYFSSKISISDLQNK